MVFIKRKCVQTKFYQALFNYLQFNKIASSLVKEVSSKNRKESIDSSALWERLYKLPDFFYFVEDDTFCLVDKGQNIFNLVKFDSDGKEKKTSPFSITIFDSDGLLWMLAAIEFFFSERRRQIC